MENRVLVFRGGIPAALLGAKNKWRIIENKKISLVTGRLVTGDWGFFLVTSHESLVTKHKKCSNL